MQYGKVWHITASTRVQGDQETLDRELEEPHAAAVEASSAGLGACAPQL